MEHELDRLFALLDDGTRFPETEQASRAAEPWARRLEQLTGSSGEFDNIWTAAVEVGASECPVWFARGFRMGARLMLEVLEGS